MRDPMPVNRAPTDEVRKAGWAAEARDNDGHLVSTLAWVDDDTINENLASLGEFISRYDHDGTAVMVFAENLKL